MRKLIIALAGATALTAASAANAALTIGTAGSTNGTAATSTPNSSTLEFDTSNGVMGSYSSFFQFNSDIFNSVILTATASTNPLSGTTVSMLQLFTGGSLSGTCPGPTCVYGGGTLVPGGSASGSGNSLTTPAISINPNTNYTFVYSGNFGKTPGNVSGNGAFALVSGPVPEPATWALMLLGFGGIGMALRRRRRPVLAQIA